MASRDHGEELKTAILRDAVEDNVDTIAGRLPKGVPPARRIVTVSRWRWTLAPPVVLIVLAIGLARWPPTPAVRPAAPATPPAGNGSRARVPAARTASPEDRALLERSLDPGVLALSVRRVVLDAGHGGDNLGTSSASGLSEKTLTLDITTRMWDLLIAAGFEVVMTRTADQSLSLQQRAETANGRRGDIFVSIHLNALKPATANGVETYYLGPSDGAEPDAVAAAENQHSGYSLSDMRTLLERIYTDARRDESRRLAAAVQRAVVARLQQIEPSIADRGVKRAPFVVLGATEMPAILAEVSCLSNRGEAERLGTAAYRQTIAEAVVAGIQTFAYDSRGHAAERTGSSGS
ncbi:MAG: N-acetylmuramoyl-L-alanine amidase [Vicinamibacterales bacterium]